MLVEYMVGSLVKNIGIQTVHQQIAYLTAGEAREQIRRLENIRKNTVSLSSAIKSEETMGTETIRAMSQMSQMSSRDRDKYTMDTIIGSKPRDLQEQISRSAVIGWARLRYGWTGSYQNYQSHIAKMIQNTSLPYAQGSKLPEITPAKDDVFSNIGIPNYQRAYLSVTFSEMNQQITLTYLGIQAYQQEHNGALPANLDILVKDGYLKELPSNPFSPNANAPLAYNSQTGEVTAQMPKVPGYEMPKSPKEYYRPK
jgi:hypothetical protein